MIVSRPVKIELEIEDIFTHCKYIYKGKTKEDCINYFENLFLGKVKYKILSEKEI